MGKYLVLIVVLLQGCNTLEKNFEPVVYIHELEASIIQNAADAGLSLPYNIESKNYKAALQIIERRYADTLENISNEERVTYELDFLESSTKNLDFQINELVSKNDTNTFAYLIRGSYLAGKAMQARGSKWISETTKEQLEKMTSLQKLAIKDFEKSLNLSETNYLALLGLADIYKTRRDDTDLSKKYYEEAINLQPASYAVWNRYLHAITPRWGGSYSAMETVIQSMKKNSKINTKLLTLQNRIIYDKANLAENAGETALAKELYSDALQFGEDDKVLVHLGRLNLYSGIREEGCSQIRKAIKMRPYKRSYNYDGLVCAGLGF